VTGAPHNPLYDTVPREVVVTRPDNAAPLRLTQTATPPLMPPALRTSNPQAAFAFL